MIIYGDSEVKGTKIYYQLIFHEIDHPASSSYGGYLHHASPRLRLLDLRDNSITCGAPNGSVVVGELVHQGRNLSPQNPIGR